jgi:hypothetical protein
MHDADDSPAETGPSRGFLPASPARSGFVIGGMVRDLEELVEEFTENVAAQTEAIKRGDARTGNKHANRYIAALKTLRSAGDAGRNALAVLLQHPRPDVRVKVAAFLLRYRTAEAKAVLEAAARGDGMAAIGATMTLKHWEEGTWNLDPE